MLEIGIAGEGKSLLKEMLTKLLELDSGITAKINLISHDTDPKGDYKILIVNSPMENLNRFVSALLPEDVLLINSDEKDINQYLNQNKARIITYGLNNKACVTASSVVEGQYKTILCCVQRSFPTYSPDTILQQEFAVNVASFQKDLHLSIAMAAVTAAIIAGVPIDLISKTVLK